MTKDPFSFELHYNNINLSEYPENAQEVGSPLFKKHLKDLLEREYKSLKGNLSTTFANDHVAVSWHPDVSNHELKHRAISLLQSGEINQAIPILETLLEAPEDAEVLYNLGMVYSDQGQLEKAIDLLSRATKADPEYVHAFVALGIAQLRAGNQDLAESALKAALKLDSDDPYSLRTLATIHMHKQDYTSAISMLRHSLSLLSNDAVSLINLATCLVKTEQEKNLTEASEIANDLVASHHGDEIEIKAKEIQRQITYIHFRQEAGDHEHSEAVFYCIDAIKKLKPLKTKEIAEIALEIAQVGNNGLQINNPSVTYNIKSFSGQFTGLALVCLLHVAIQKVSPDTDSGFDLQKEYEIADKLVNKP